MNYELRPHHVSLWSEGLLSKPIQPGIIAQNTHKKRGRNFEFLPTFVPHNEIFSNRFLEDLEKIWELRYYIPDPNKLEYANCDCAPCSRYKGEIIQGW